MSKITRIEQRTQAIKSELFAISPVKPGATQPTPQAPPHHPVYRAVWGIGIILLAGFITGALYFGIMKGGIIITPTGLFGIAVVCLILIMIMFLLRPK
jgi:amino acid transporter